jgi:hypothetical protein
LPRLDAIHELFPDKNTDRISPTIISNTANAILDNFGDDVGTKIHSITFETTIPQRLSDILKAPATELVRFSDPRPPFLSLFEDFLGEFCSPALGCLGAVIGWELDEDGFSGRKTCVGLLGWESVEHHVKATKNEEFEEAAGRFMGEVTGGVEAWHVNLKEL